MVFSYENFSKKDRNMDTDLWAEIVYNKEEIKNVYPNAKIGEYKKLIFDDIKKNVNEIMPAYKHIKKIIK